MVPNHPSNHVQITLQSVKQKQILSQPKIILSHGVLLILFLKLPEYTQASIIECKLTLDAQVYILFPLQRPLFVD